MRNELATGPTMKLRSASFLPSQELVKPEAGSLAEQRKPVGKGRALVGSELELDLARDICR